MRSQVLLVSHGTRDPRGQAVVDELCALVRDRLPGYDVGQAFVDVQAPRLRDAVAAADPERPLLLVPLLLSRGYHVQVDLPQAAAGHPDAQVTPALGPDPALVPVLLDRLAAAGAAPEDPCVLVATGSRLPEAALDVQQQAAWVGAAHPGPVQVAYCSAVGPKVDDVVAACSGAVSVSSYLLAPGHFLTALGRVGADRVAGALGADARVADLVASRVTAAFPRGLGSARPCPGDRTTGSAVQRASP